MARVEAFLKTIEQLNPNVNAFICTNTDALAQGAEAEERVRKNTPKSDIDGMVMSIKDNIHVAGLPNTAGTLALRDFMPAHNAPLVDTLLAAGAVCIGKAHMEEMARGITCYNPLYCQGGVEGVRNAHDHSKIAGGSSGGSAVSVAMEMCDVSLGSDTAGSVRIPAALNGVVGFRPSTGRYSSEGVTPISHTRDTIGILSGGVGDTQRVDSVITGDRVHTLSRDVNIVVGYDGVNSLANCSDEVLAGWSAVIDTLREDARFTVVEVDTTLVRELCALTSTAILQHECYADLKSYLHRYIPDLTVETLVEQITTPSVKNVYLRVIHDHSSEYEHAMNSTLPALVRAYMGMFDGKINVLLSPTTPITAVAADPEELWTRAPEIRDIYIQNVNVTSIVGAPSITIPVRNPTGGLPIGVLVDGNVGCDSYVLAVAKYIEEMLK